MKNSFRFLDVLVILLTGFFSISSLASANVYNATDVIGQNKSDGTPVWTTGGVNNEGNVVGPNALNQPYSDVVIDSVHHRLFLSDSSNNRVLVFNLNEDGTLVDHNADYVLGQPDFDTVDAATSQNKLDYPWGLTYDSIDNRLFVGECGSTARITVFDTTTITNGMNASYVLGQPDFTTSDSPISQNAFKVNGCITGLAHDSIHNRLFVADNGNSRVMVFDTTTITNGMNASYVLGQPDFISSDPNTTQNGLYNPISIVYDSNNRLFVLDNENHRIMVFDVTNITDGMDAINVLGQPDFISNNQNINQSGLSSSSYGLAYDSNSNLLFADDSGNNRVMIFDVTAITDGEDAVNVLGQSDFVTNTVNTTQNGLNTPSGLGYNLTNNHLYITDADNNRIMIFDTSTITDGMNAVDVIGQNKSDGTPVWTTSGANNAGNTVGPNAINDPEGDMAVDTVHHRLFVNDSSNNRVLVFNLNEDGTLVDHNADYVLGQPDFDTVTSGTTQSKMNYPMGLTYDSIHNRLFVIDDGNNRVLVFDTTLIISGEDAINVLGQQDFISNNNSTTQNGLSSWVIGLTFNQLNNYLFVGDTGNNRVLIFDTTTITNGEDAINVLGQSNFTSSDSNTTQSGLNHPENFAFDPVNNRLFVGDYENNRITIFDTTTITNGEDAINVIGQPDFTTNNFNTNQSGFNLNSVYGLNYDSINNRLFVADDTNCRVMVFDTTTITNGMDAINVLGQTDFVSNACTTTQNGLGGTSGYGAEGLGFDSINNILYVADDGNNRIMIFHLIKQTTDSLVSGTIGISYSQTLTSKGYQGNVSYEVTDGTLPDGLTLTDNTISGTPTTAGTYTFTITASDNWTENGFPLPFTDSKSYTIEIVDNTPPVTHSSSGSSISSQYNNLIAMGNTALANQIANQYPTQINPTTSTTLTPLSHSILQITQTLRQGTKGNDVLSLQSHLNSLGYNTGTPDGSFGPKTLSAIIQFQKDHNLTPDGIVGPKTLELLNNSNPSNIQAPITTPTSTTRTLKQGMKGDDVKQLQSYLSSKGYDIGTIDGVFGLKTDLAAKKFQQDNNLTPDGVVGPLTQSLLK